jgi:hypothetical protein
MLSEGQGGGEFPVGLLAVAGWAGRDSTAVRVLLNGSPFAIRKGQGPIFVGPTFCPNMRAGSTHRVVGFARFLCTRYTRATVKININHEPTTTACGFSYQDCISEYRSL